MESHKPKIPRLIGGVDVRSLPLTPMEGFVLSRIDASATLADIADLTSLELAEVVRIVDKLQALEVVEWADGHVSYPRATPKTSGPARSTTQTGMSRAAPEPLQKHVTEVPKAVGPDDPSAHRISVRVFAPPPPRAPQLDRLGTTSDAPGPRAEPATSPTVAPRAKGNAGLHAERPAAAEHIGPRPPPRPASRPPTAAPSSPPPPAAPKPSSPPPGAAPAEPVTADTHSSPAPDAVVTAPEGAGTEGAASKPSDGIDLPHDRRKRIDDLYFALDLLDHYEVLGVSRRADKAKIRSSYFEGSKAFHPDTVFRRSVGGYRAKMEAIFSRLTEAYEVLGKKKAREEYDAYLESIGETRAAEEALSGEHEVPPELRAGAEVATPAASAPPGAMPPSAPPITSAPVVEDRQREVSAPPAPSKQSTPTDEGRRVAREVLQKRMDAMRSQSRPRPSKPAEPVSPPAAAFPPAEPRSQKEALRDLTSSIKSAAALTGGLDQVSRHVAEARRALEQNDLANAVRAYRFAFALAPERADIEREMTKHAKDLAVSLADRYETQALYEERYKKWASAATSWAKVIEGRPEDTKALTHAAIALVEAKGDLHQARRFAQKATELAPADAAARRALGRVFMAAGLGLNAKRELEQARTMDPSDELTKLLLREIETHQKS